MKLTVTVEDNNGKTYSHTRTFGSMSGKGEHTVAQVEVCAKAAVHLLAKDLQEQGVVQ